VTVEYANLERSSVAAKKARVAKKAAEKAEAVKGKGGRGGKGASSTVWVFMLLQTVAVLAFGAYCLLQVKPITFSVF
jgi:hypothetical protein